MPDADTPQVWQQAILLNRYYEKVGRAAADQGHCPRFREFRAGFAPGLVDETAVDEATGRPKPTLLPIPPDLESIPNEFFRAAVEVGYSDGVTLCKCEIPQGGVAVPKEHNIIGIYDQDDDLVAACTTLTDWVTPSEVYRAFPAVTFPIQKGAPE